MNIVVNLSIKSTNLKHKISSQHFVICLKKNDLFAFQAALVISYKIFYEILNEQQNKYHNSSINTQ